MKAMVFVALAAVGLAGIGTALAQPAPEAPPAPPATAPVAPAAPAEAATPAPAVTLAPAPPVAPTPPAPPPAPPPPTGEAAAVISMIDKACTPLIRGQSIKSVADANGLKHARDDDWVLPLQGVERITLTPPTYANPHVCTLTVNLEIDQSKPIVDALNGWAAAQTPSMAPLSTAYQSSPGVTSWSWAGDTQQVHEGLVFSAQKQPDGKPVGHGYDVATVLFSLTGS